MIVENRAGAGGNTGADAVAKAQPDGYTLLMSSAGILTANPFLYAKMPFDAETAFIPVSNVADMSMLVVVNPKVEAKTLGELVAFAKAKPDKLNFGSPGIGTTGHLGLAMLMHAAEHQDHACAVSRRGAGGHRFDRRADRRRGRQSADRAAAHRSRQVAAAGGGGDKRMALLPDVPTAAEAGVANYEASSWFGIAAPAGTPPAIVERLHAAVATAVRTPAMQQRFATTGARLVGDTPAEFAAQIKAERAMWGGIIKAANIKAE